jgi:hypothetical protein
MGCANQDPEQDSEDAHTSGRATNGVMIQTGDLGRLTQMLLLSGGVRRIPFLTADPAARESAAWKAG